VATDPTLAGTVLSDVFVPFNSEGALGQVETRVVQETVSQTLDFYFRVFVDVRPCPPCGSAGIGALRIDDVYPLPVVDVDFLSDSPGTEGPVSAERASPRLGSLYPGIYFFVLLDPGESSKEFFLRSSATDSQFVLGAHNATVYPGPLVPIPIDGVLQPSPEPSTWLLLAPGLAVLLFWTTCRRVPDQPRWRLEG